MSHEPETLLNPQRKKTRGHHDDPHAVVHAVRGLSPYVPPYIGLYLLSSIVDPDSYMGMTFTNFSSSGKLPSRKYVFMRNVSGMI